LEKYIMRITSILVASLISAFVAVPAFAQQYQGTTNNKAVQIQGNTDIKASQENATATAIGKDNEAKNTSGAIKGGTQIQGNTTIQSKQKGASATAIGKGNKASNEAGVIGGSDVVNGAAVVGGPKGSMGMGNQNGVQIQGNTDIKAGQENANATAIGKGNEARNSAGVIKGGTQIQGNTKINAQTKNTSAVAIGKGNKASNEAGVIGGN
jgi:hypothetical protein